MLRFTTILGLAITAIALLSAPMAAARWTHNGVPLAAGQNPQVELTGQTAFTSAVVGGIECQRVAKMQLFGNQTTGQLDTFEVDLAEPSSTFTQKCNTSGPLAPCAMKSTQATGLPWTLHSDGADTLSITTGDIDYTFESKDGKQACGVVPGALLTAGTAIAQIKAGETSGIKELHMSGQFKMLTGAKVTLHGTIGIVGVNSGTYGTA